jgi:hypothetical protein
LTLGEYLSVRKILSEKQHFNVRTHAITSPLDKLIICGNCGRLMQVNLSKGKYVYLQKCNAYKYGEKCDNSGCSLNYILPQIYNEVRKCRGVIQRQLEQLKSDGASNILDDLRKQLSTLEKQLKTKEGEKDKLLNFLLKGTVKRTSLYE